jgi:Secretion system C-terminal sorting domain
MKKIVTFFLAYVFTFSIFAQVSQDYAVMIQSSVTESPAAITLTWNINSGTQNVRVYRKVKNTMYWGTPIATLGAVTTYTDHSVVAGNAYEYYINRNDNANSADGYIYVGIKLPETTYRGKLLLMVDGNYVTPLTNEIAQLQNDLIADGWQVQRFDIPRSYSVAVVKSIITNAKKADKNTKALYLLGRIPVPYSGVFVGTSGQTYPPDGHPQHAGAWPADMYYGCFNEPYWTDFLTDTIGDRKENWNYPNDGKFDQMYIYGYDSVALQIGRVDLTNMPSFALNDTELTKQYLNKAHKFKTGQFNIVRRGLVKDNFGAMGGEAFASSGWRDLTTMFGDSVFSREYLATLKHDSYLFNFACGGGTYNSCSGVGKTSDFATDSVNQVFTFLFGSFFGDWDSQDNLLRAPLCSMPSALVSVWSGRPHWHIHHMSLGENIGYSTQLTQNNIWSASSPTYGYVHNNYPTFTYIALMGDPSLRLHSMIPCPSVKATSSIDSNSIKISWQPSIDATDGYDIFTSRNNGKYVQIGTALSTDTTFTYSAPGFGMNYFMVRPKKIEMTPSGTYYNLGLGVVDSAYSKRATGVDELSKNNSFINIYPNPSNGIFTISMENAEPKTTIKCYDLVGRIILEKSFNENNYQIDLSTFSKGIYFLDIKCGMNETVKKIILE